MAQNSLSADKASVTAGRLLLRQLTKEQKPHLSLAVLFGTLASVAMIFQWFALASITHTVIILQQSVAEQWLSIGLMLISLVTRSGLSRMQEHYSQLASLNAREMLRQRILQSWQHTSALTLSQRSPGAAASQLIEDVEAIDGYFSRFWPQQMLAVFTPVLILLVVFYYNWLAALFLLLAAPLIPFFMMLIGFGAESVNQRFFNQRQRLAGHFLDRVKHLTTITLFAAQPAALNEIKQRSQDYRHIVMKTLKLAFLSSAVLEFFTSVAIASIAIYIGFALFGSISWGPAAGITLFNGLFILLLAPEFFQPLRNLSQFYHDRAAAVAAVSQIANTLQSEKQSLHTELANTPELNTPSHLVIRQLHIGYQPDKALQEPVNLTLEKGQCLVISGASGSGKTTFLHTLAGFLPPLSGDVLLNNQPVATIPIHYLPQKPWIIAGSWQENLRVLATKASVTEMQTALTTLGFTDAVLSRDNGLDNLVNEHGQGLSGGQLQRLALARSLLSPAPLLLLDEPTASLDSVSRKIVINALSALKAQTIVVISSHDPDVLAIADQQLIFSSGQAGDAV